MYFSYLSGLPPSGKIRENFDLLESQGKSGNFNIFSRESGKVRENDLAEVTQSLSLISRHIFVKTQWLQVQKFSSLRSGFHMIPICAVRSGKVRRKSQGKSGNSNRADWWQPCFSFSKQRVVSDSMILSCYLQFLSEINKLCHWQVWSLQRQVAFFNYFHTRNSEKFTL